VQVHGRLRDLSLLQRPHVHVSRPFFLRLHATFFTAGSGTRKTHGRNSVDRRRRYQFASGFRFQSRVIFSIRIFQLAIWQTATHPCVKSFSQCMSKDYLGLLDSRFVLAYTIVTAVQSYFLPLAIVVFCYSLIFCRLHSTVETQKYGELKLLHPLNLHLECLNRITMFLC
jgi:hypothetical protein